MCSDLNLSWILFCPSRWSQSSTKLPLTIRSTFPPECSVLFLAFAFIFCRALFLTYCSISWCCWIHDVFDFIWQHSYCKGPSQLSHSTGAFLPNITLVGLVASSYLWGSIVCKDQGSLYAGQFTFWSFGKVFIKFSKVWLNLSQIELPHVIYGVVVICWTPYLLHKWCII